MAQNFSIKVKGLEELERKYARAGAIIEKHNRPAMQKAVGLTADNVKSFAPERSGKLKGQIEEAVRGRGVELVGSIAPSKTIGREVYPYVIEFGRGAGKAQPPVASIQEKMGVGRSEAFIIARAIGRYGHKAFKYMKRGWEKSKDQIQDLFQDSLRKIIRELDR